MSLDRPLDNKPFSLVKDKSKQREKDPKKNSAVASDCCKNSPTRSSFYVQNACFAVSHCGCCMVLAV
jgi:hypothetical protein